MSWLLFIQQLDTHSLHFTALQIVTKRISVTMLSLKIAGSCSCLAITIIYVTLQVLYTALSSSEKTKTDVWVTLFYGSRLLLYYKPLLWFVMASMSRPSGFMLYCFPVNCIMVDEALFYALPVLSLHQS